MKTKREPLDLEMVNLSKQEIMKAMPKLTGKSEGAAPVRYKGGVIYTSVKSKWFRALRRRGDKYSEVRSSFRQTPQKEAWTKAVHAIDDEYKSSGAKKQKR